MSWKPGIARSALSGRSEHLSLLLLDTNIWALLVRAELGRVREDDKAKTRWYQGELKGQQLARCFATDAELERGELDIEAAQRESLTQMRRALLNQASLIPSSPAISAKWATLVYEAKQRAAGSTSQES